MAAVGPRFDEASARKGAQLQRDGAEGDIRHAAMDGARRELVAPHQAKDLAPARRRDGREKRGVGWHFYILVITKILSRAMEATSNRSIFDVS